jgi:hypothetical protein
VEEAVRDYSHPVLEFLPLKTCMYQQIFHYLTSTAPNALYLYGIKDDEYEVGKPSMYDAVHNMRTRIMTSKSFTGDRILAAILFEDTMSELSFVPSSSVDVQPLLIQKS